MVAPANVAKQQGWRTPPALVQELADRYAGGAFDFDVAASSSNSVGRYYIGEDDDALRAEWDGTCFCNPPYRDIEPWVEHAIRDVRDAERCVVVMLLPARTGTQWFAIARASALVHVEFIRGRVAFIHPETGKAVPGNYEDSLVLVIRKPDEHEPILAKDYR